MGASIRQAIPEDAVKIYRILVNNLKEYMIFTGYSSRKSINLIKKDIKEAESHISLVKIWRVLEIDNKLAGFSCIERLRNELSLNYIAVDRSRRGAGLGTNLIIDFEELAKNYGLRKVLLEVFKSNELAFNWYKSKKYEEMSYKLLYLLSIEKQKRRIPTNLIILNEVLEAAINEEKQNGAAKVSAIYAGEDIELGIIAGKYLKIVKPDIVTNFNLIKELSYYFYKKRKYIIMATKEDLYNRTDFERKEILVKMIKSLI